jgi:GT2 family glycosyltransferase
MYEMYYPQIMEGIVGNCVFLKKEVFKKIGILDEQIQAADWDLYLRVKKRAEEVNDLHRVMTICWAYVHHFIRTTLKSNPEPFACLHPKRNIEEKWDRRIVTRLWPFPHEVVESPFFYRAPVKYWRYKREKIKSRRIRTENENQWIQVWKELD